MVAQARCLPRTSCCCYAGASAESVRFLVFCLGCWPKPWGWTASPGAPHLGASSLRRRNRTRRRAASRASRRRARARPLRAVAGDGQAARSWRTARRGNLGPARTAAEGGAAQGSPKARHHFPPRGSRLRVPTKPPCATSEARGRARTAGTATTPQRRSHTSGTGPTPRLDLSPRCMNPTQVPGHQPHGWCLRMRRGRSNRRQVAAPPDHTALGAWVSSR
jgi:hypothetical protein